jgi:UDP-glucuronate 4-epimerase
MATVSPVLVTGAAGFIGFTLACRLLDSGRPVVGTHNLTPYYDPKLKETRLAVLRQFPVFSFLKVDLADRVAIAQLFRDGTFGPWFISRLRPAYGGLQFLVIEIGER